jgi:hypothetical protein
MKKYMRALGLHRKRRKILGKYFETLPNAFAYRNALSEIVKISLLSGKPEFLLSVKRYSSPSLYSVFFYINMFNRLRGYKNEEKIIIKSEYLIIFIYLFGYFPNL